MRGTPDEWRWSSLHENAFGNMADPQLPSPLAGEGQGVRGRADEWRWSSLHEYTFASMADPRLVSGLRPRAARPLNALARNAGYGTPGRLPDRGFLSMGKAHGQSEYH